MATPTLRDIIAQSYVPANSPIRMAGNPAPGFLPNLQGIQALGPAGSTGFYNNDRLAQILASQEAGVGRANAAAIGSGPTGIGQAAGVARPALPAAGETGVFNNPALARRYMKLADAEARLQGIPRPASTALATRGAQGASLAEMAATGGAGGAGGGGGGVNAAAAAGGVPGGRGIPMTSMAAGAGGAADDVAAAALRSGKLGTLFGLATHEDPAFIPCVAHQHDVGHRHGEAFAVAHHAGQ